MTKLTIKEKQEIANQLLGSCSTGQYLVELYELDIFDGLTQVCQAAEENGVRLCEDCGWWCDEYDLEDEVCEQCREYD
jgi:hypothetical protein